MGAGGSSAVLDPAVEKDALERAAADVTPRPSTPSPQAPRWLALDLFRFAAAALMVQGHVFTELLSSDYAGDRWFRHHRFVHGYTAPMFLFAAGLAFGVTTFRAWDKTTRPGRALSGRLGRYAMLVAVGYVLHWPALTPAGFASLGDGEWTTFLSVDVLQHIGVSLGLVQLLAMVVRKPERLVTILAVAFALVVSFAPYLYDLDASAVVPRFVAGYLSAATGSPFPLLPWALFSWAGVLVAWGLRDVERPSWDALGPLLVTTALVLLVPIAVNRLGLRPYGTHDFWRSGPYYLFFRLGNVMAVLCAACLAERAIAPIRATVVTTATRFAGLVGQESLVVYVAHMALLHGVVATTGLATHLGHQLSFGEAVLATVLIGTASMGVAAAWGARKQRKPVAATA